MAAQKTVMRRTAQAAKWIAAALVLVVAAFFLSAWIGSSIPRNSDWEEPETGVTIMLETNDVHTGIIMPLVTPQHDWRTLFPASDLDNPDRPYTHVSVSFGERETFLNTPTLAEISVRTAVGAAFGGDGLLHIAHYVRPMPANDFRELTIGADEYAALVRIIADQIPPVSPQREAYDGYAAHDVFYDTQLTYHLGHTCNQWTSNTLAAAGIKTGWWTPIAGGVTKWVDPPA
ncbi:MAG: DUF2459 domain-containing protein [Marinomonas sp.]